MNVSVLFWTLGSGRRYDDIAVDVSDRNETGIGVIRTRYRCSAHRHRYRAYCIGRLGLDLRDKVRAVLYRVPGIT